jgi:GNAT superfamily N-acetyltransferase
VDVRAATVDDAGEVARLLHDFNGEFDTPSPGVEILTSRLRSLLADTSTFAIVAEQPAVAVALVTLRSNVWYDGSVALLDELYVAPSRRNEGIGTAVLDAAVSTAHAAGAVEMEINVDEGDVDAQRFYVRHEFSDIDPAAGERAVYFSRTL